MSETVELVFPDPQGYADLAALVRRARRADPDAAVRLSAAGTTLVCWVGILPGSGLFAEGAAVGVRAGALAAPARLDVVVSAGALGDRFARDEAARTSPRILTVPPVPAFAAWAGSLPGASGWEPVGQVPREQVEQVARDGIAEIAAGTVDGAGSLAVQALRARVWSRVIPLLDNTIHPDVGVGDEPDRSPGSAPGGWPAAAAFAAYALGFLRTEQPWVTCYRSGRWTRLRTSVGHVLAR